MQSKGYVYLPAGLFPAAVVAATKEGERAPLYSVNAPFHGYS